jgi:hypothetical protein
MESRAAQRAHSKNWPVRDVIIIYNMRYKDSVEDRVHELLSNRLKSIHKMFGQLPDILRDVWIDVAQGRIESARQLIDSLPKKKPFDLRWHTKIEKVSWETCATVLDSVERRTHLSKAG